MRQCIGVAFGLPEKVEQSVFRRRGRLVAAGTVGGPYAIVALFAAASFSAALIQGQWLRSRSLRAKCRTVRRSLRLRPLRATKSLDAVVDHEGYHDHGDGEVTSR